MTEKIHSKKKKTKDSGNNQRKTSCPGDHPTRPAVLEMFKGVAFTFVLAQWLRFLGLPTKTSHSAWISYSYTAQCIPPVAIAKKENQWLLVGDGSKFKFIWVVQILPELAVQIVKAAKPKQRYALCYTTWVRRRNVHTVSTASYMLQLPSAMWPDT